MERELINQLVSLVSIPSVTGQEGEILFFLEEDFAARGVDFERQRVEGGWYNILVGEVEKPKFIIAAHVDTVPPLDGTPPRPIVEGNVIKGLGAADDKAGVAVMWALAAEFKEALKKKGILLAFLVDEEKTGMGSWTLVNEVSAEGAIVIEPTGLEICTFEAGSLEVVVDVKGKAAHGSCVEEGENSIHRALDIIKGFDGLSFVGKSYPGIGRCSYSIMSISSGDFELRIPDRCSFMVDFRLSPDEDVERAVDELVGYLKKVGASYRFVDISPGFVVSENEEVVSLLKFAYRNALAREPVVGGMRSWTDAEHFVRKGIPAVVFGPGELWVCHTPDERVSVSQVLDCYRVLKSFVEEA